MPKPLRGRFKSSNGRPLSKIVEGLSTDSLKEAQAKAAKRRAHWLQVFERAKHDVPLTLGEIQAEAMEAYRVTLARMVSEAATWIELIGNEKDWLRSNLERCERELAASDFSSVQPDIEAIERRKGVQLDPDRDTYQSSAKSSAWLSSSFLVVARYCRPAIDAETCQKRPPGLL